MEGVVAAVTANTDLWVSTMLRDEYGLPDSVRSAPRAALLTLSAFLACGLVPLIPFVLGLDHAFGTSCALTGLVFVLIGAVKSRWSTRRWWRSAFGTLALGGAAAAIAFVIGSWLRGLAG